jgi:hypothetical protein
VECASGATSHDNFKCAACNSACQVCSSLHCTENCLIGQRPSSFGVSTQQQRSDTGHAAHAPGGAGGGRLRGLFVSGLGAPVAAPAADAVVMHQGICTGCQPTSDGSCECSGALSSYAQQDQQCHQQRWGAERRSMCSMCAAAPRHWRLWYGAHQVTSETR